jgi:hypothetical protein
MSALISAMMIAAAAHPILGISAIRLAARAGAIICSIRASRSAMSASIASTRLSVAIHQGCVPSCGEAGVTAATVGGLG